MAPPRNKHILSTGLTDCFDAVGAVIDCHAPRASGQDAALRLGSCWPTPRFLPVGNDLVQDLLTNLIWPRNANLFGFPCTWSEAFDLVRQYNSDFLFDRNDWRLPNRNELRSIISHGASRPSLPVGHPFYNVFHGWYWSSTTAARAPTYAWYVNLAGARTFYGAKIGHAMLWPVCGSSVILPRTGQTRCYDMHGRAILDRDAPLAALQDGALQLGVPWPQPRFSLVQYGALEAVHDNLTNIVWHRATTDQGRATWEQALAWSVRRQDATGLPWHLPNINELASLVDANACDPALPNGHPFPDPAQAYWSATTSAYATDWSYCLYLDKGAIGVGHKSQPEFHTWLAMEGC